MWRSLVNFKRRVVIWHILLSRPSPGEAFPLHIDEFAEDVTTQGTEASQRLEKRLTELCSTSL